MGMMPVNSSPDVVLINGLNEWRHSDKPQVAQGLTRLVSLIAYPIIALLGALYNAAAFVIKAPLTLIRYTIGFIPTKEGRVADLLPEDTTMKHMAWHLYKMLFTPFDLGLCYPLSIIHPGANISLHEKMALVPQETRSIPPKKEGGAEASIPIQPSGPIPPPPNPENLKTFKLKTWKEKQAEEAAKKANAGASTSGEEQAPKKTAKKEQPKGFGGFDPTASPLFVKAKATIV